MRLDYKVGIKHKSTGVGLTAYPTSFNLVNMEKLRLNLHGCRLAARIGRRHYEAREERQGRTR